MDETKAHKRLITVREAAIFLGISESTLRHRKCKGGVLTEVRVGHAVRFDIKELETFVENRGDDKL